MNSLLVYLLQSSISLIVFYLAYELLFRMEAYFQFIRYYFLFAIVTSAILPMMNIDINQLMAINYDIPIIIYPIPTLVEYTLGEVTIYANPTTNSEVGWINQFSLPVLFLSIYISKSSSFCLRALISLAPSILRAAAASRSGIDLV